MIFEEETRQTRLENLKIGALFKLKETDPVLRMKLGTISELSGNTANSIRIATINSDQNTIGMREHLEIDIGVIAYELIKPISIRKLV